MKNKIILINFLLFVFVILTACSDQTPNIAETETTTNQINLAKQIISGDFSSLDIPEDDDTLLSQLERMFYHFQDNPHEWTEIDLNGDGIKELVLQVPTHHEGINRIEAIFTFDYENNETELVYWHHNDLLRFLLLGANRNLVHYHFSYGTYNWDSYTHVIFDDSLRYV